MEYRHFIFLGGGNKLFAYDFVTPLTIDVTTTLGKIIESFRALNEAGVSSQRFNLTSPTLSAVIAYDPYFEQFEFVPTWAEFLQHVADWNHITLPQNSPAIQAAIELLDKDDSHVDSEKGAAEA